MYKSVEDFFSKANQTTEYAVLRNFEEFGSSSFLLQHPDIDLICTDRNTMINELDLLPRGKSIDTIHRKVLINDIYVPVDLRCPGDGYYCEKWESGMIKNRKYGGDGYYILSDEDYRFSLLYHVLIQKDNISADYKLRISRMFNDETDISLNEVHYLRILEDFMSDKGYFFTFPENSKTIFHYEKVSKVLIEPNFRKLIGRKVLHLLNKA